MYRSVSFLASFTVVVAAGVYVARTLSCGVGVHGLAPASERALVALLEDSPLVSEPYVIAGLQWLQSAGYEELLEALRLEGYQLRVEVYRWSWSEQKWTLVCVRGPDTLEWPCSVRQAIAEHDGDTYLVRVYVWRGRLRFKLIHSRYPARRTVSMELCGGGCLGPVSC